MLSNDHVSYSYCQKKVKNLNISFVKLGEECEVCELHIFYLKEEHMLTEIRAHTINRWEKN